MRKSLSRLFVLSVLVILCVARPANKEAKERKDIEYDLANTDGMTTKEARDTEYFRYLNQVFAELEKDPQFQKAMENASDADIKSGKFLEKMDLIGHHVREKLDEVKRLEIEYQHELVRQKKLHMVDKEHNDWNPIHHANKKTFGKEDLKKLLHKQHKMMEMEDKARREEFKQYEMQKEHKRRHDMKNMTAAQKEDYMKKYNETHHSKHEKMHSPGHKAQLEEAWEKDDHLDPESFDEKTLFHLHDKNGDGYLDQYELETLFLSELDKVYNESDPNTDTKERHEELERMREEMMDLQDHDKDGMISLEEFMQNTKREDYKKDDEWHPLTESDQYSDDEMNEYEKQHPDDEHHDEEHHDTPGEHHDAPPQHHDEEHRDAPALHIDGSSPHQDEEHHDAPGDHHDAPPPHH